MKEFVNFFTGYKILQSEIITLIGKTNKLVLLKAQQKCY